MSTHPDASVLETKSNDIEAPHYQDDVNEATARFLLDDDGESVWDDEFDSAIIESEVVAPNTDITTDTDTEQASRPKRRLYFIFIVMPVLIVCLAIGASLNYLLQHMWSTPSDPVDANAILEHFMQHDLPSYSVRAIHHNDTSPQHRALVWLGEDPKLRKYPAWKRKQRYALATFYYSVGGEHWNYSRQQLEANYYGKDSSKLWMSYDVDECDWYSSSDNPVVNVNTNPVCAKNGKYRSLHLSDMNLAGTLPDELELLFGMESIRLVSYQEDILGRLPRRLGLLASLHTLILNGIGLAGEIPDGFARCSGLQHVDLSRNFLSGPLPIFIFSAWRNLISLSIETNLFTGRVADVDDSVIAHWSKSLVSLDLSDNSLSGSIGHAIGNHLSSLESLKLMDNNLEGEIPENLKLLSQLQELLLFKNRLTGKIPTHLGELKRLRTLDVGGNFLSGEVPTFLGSLGQLTNLNLAENDLHGHIPSNLGDLTNLRIFHMHANHFSGPIPRTLGQLTSIREMFLWRNNLAGTVPSEIGALTNMMMFDMSANQISGQLPSEIGLWSNVVNLSLFGNALTGTIPSEIGGMTALQKFWINTNALSGQLPTTIGLATNLIEIVAYENDLSGSLPDEVSHAVCDGRIIGLCSVLPRLLTPISLNVAWHVTRTYHV